MKIPFVKHGSMKEIKDLIMWLSAEIEEPRKKEWMRVAVRRTLIMDSQRCNWDPQNIEATLDWWYSEHYIHDASEDELRKKVADMSSHRMIALLTTYGFAVYDYEDRATLAEAILANIKDGTIPVEELEENNG